MASTLTQAIQSQRQRLNRAEKLAAKLEKLQVEVLGVEKELSDLGVNLDGVQVSKRGRPRGSTNKRATTGKAGTLRSIVAGLMEDGEVREIQTIWDGAVKNGWDSTADEKSRRAHIQAVLGNKDVYERPERGKYKMTSDAIKNRQKAAKEAEKVNTATK